MRLRVPRDRIACLTSSNCSHSSHCVALLEVVQAAQCVVLDLALPLRRRNATLLAAELLARDVAVLPAPRAGSEIKHMPCQSVSQLAGKKIDCSPISGQNDEVYRWGENRGDFAQSTWRASRSTATLRAPPLAPLLLALRPVRGSRCSAASLDRASGRGAPGVRSVPPFAQAVRLHVVVHDLLVRATSLPRCSTPHRPAHAHFTCSAKTTEPRCLAAECSWLQDWLPPKRVPGGCASRRTHLLPLVHHALELVLIITDAPGCGRPAQASSNIAAALFELVAI
jgi:hypothetical protein